MSVITVQKPFTEIDKMLFQRADLHVVILGCDKCAKVNKTGGSAEVRGLRSELERRNYMMLKLNDMVDAVEEGLCDPEAVSKQLEMLAVHKGQFQCLVMACGAGLKCVRDLLPGVRIVPGLNTLGPGVKDQLACLACGDCRFGEEGCQMTRLVSLQATNLSKSYDNSRSRISEQ